MNKLLSAGILLAICLATHSSTAAPTKAPEWSPADFDHRGNGGVTAGQRQGLTAIRQSAPDLQVRFDKLTGAPRSIMSRRGFLTGPDGIGKTVSAQAAAGLAADDPNRATKAFLQEHRQLFGHGPEALAAARVLRDDTTAHNGLHTMVWQQEVDGIPVFEATLVSHVTRKGELVSISSGFLPDLASAAARYQSNRSAVQSAPQINGAAAICAVVKGFGTKLAVAELKPLAAATGAEQRQRFEPVKNAVGRSSAGLTWLPMSRDELRLCWDVTVTVHAAGGMFRALVDAQTSEVWLRRSLTRDISAASYRVFTNDSPTPFSPGYNSPQTNQPALASRTLVTLAALDTNASPAGWINDGDNETLGNNVDAHTDWDFNDEPDLPRPSSPTRVFDFSMDLTTQDPTNYSDAAVVQLFYLCNWMHDRLYQLGFTESAGNFQTDNFGRGGLGGDALSADAQDGEDVNNANMSTPPDGEPPLMQMYIFSGSSPRRDGDLDAEVVLHEYTHGLTWRLVGGGQGLGTSQSDGMGEGWSDFYALALLSQPTDNVNGCYAAGAYATYKLGGPSDTANYYFGIRRYPYSTSLTNNPLTFNDIDLNQADHCSSGAPFHTSQFGSCADDVPYSDEAHNQGEVWCSILWETRAAMIAKYGASAGNELILQLVTDALKLTPFQPNFTDARDAILLADDVDIGGANREELWAAFAKRGLGASAWSPDSTITEGVIESFDLPDDLFIQPNVGFVASGPSGGPFKNASTNLMLTNIGTAALTWSLASAPAWLDVIPANGVLTPGGAATSVAVTLNANADSLPSGVTEGSLVFTNQTSGRTQQRLFKVRVNLPDNFTEQFFNAVSMLAGQSWTFTPNGGYEYYSVCRTPATVFPTDPTGGTVLNLIDDSNAKITLSGAKTLSLYGQRTNVFFIGSNGYLTLGSGDNNPMEGLEDHFNLPRISALFHDLDPSSGGTVYYKELADRIAVTFVGIPEWYFTNRVNDFQVEWFYDGRIRLTYLNIGLNAALVGLSAGTGVPSDFLASDFLNYDACLPAMSLQLPAEASEGDGVLSGQGHVQIPSTLESNLVVILNSDNTNKLVVPSTVNITAGQTNADFNLTVVDNAQLDGSQLAIVSANAPGFSPELGVVLVHDNEPGGLQINLPDSVSEDVGVVSGSVSVNAPVTSPVVVQLASSNPELALIPQAVTIPSGATIAPFNVSVTDDILLNGNREVTFTAQVNGWTNGVKQMTVIDNEDPYHPVVTFSNLAYINIPSSGAGSPYPSAINISDLVGTVTKVTATLINLNHTWPDDLDILLVGPAGDKVMLMSDAGYGYVLNNVTLTFDDSSPNVLPDSDAIVFSTYRPGNYGTTSDAFNAPAPVGPYGSNLSVFNDANPNGDWKLFVMDDLPGDSGNISNGWSINLYLELPPAWLAPSLASNQTLLRFQSVVGYNYTISYKNTLSDTNWQTLTNLPGDGTIKVVPDLIGTNKSRFYQLQIP